MDYHALRPFATSMRRRLMAAVAQQLDIVTAPASLARRDHPAAVADLERALAATGRTALVDAVAYSWFNRFVALRFMDVHRYTAPAIVSPPADGLLQPEILVHAKNTIFTDIPDHVRSRVIALLTGQTPAPNPDEAAYRLLLVAACHRLHATLEFLFAPVDDFSELLLPIDLTSPQSLLAELRLTLTDDLCQSVELIGWLYQFYIAERKDEVMGAKSAYATADIPAVTQLFTPNWIVRYLVENSLGRLWLRSFPQSTLAQHMPYYVADDPQAPAPATLTVSDPTEIRLLDPACGSGHMLSYAFDLLMHIYREVGYQDAEIPALILRHNLYGIDLCPRASQLAAMALVLKARAVDRFFFGRTFVAPQIRCLTDVSIAAGELESYRDALALGPLFDANLRTLLGQFSQASTFGSLIRPALGAHDIAWVRQQMQAANLGNDLFLQHTHQRIATILGHAEYLSQRYHVVVANPPYMGNKGMNSALKEFAGKHYPDSKSDLFAMFIERGFDLALRRGYSAMVTMQSWMFLSSYEKLRLKTLENQTITTLTQMGNMVMGIAFGTSATVWVNAPHRAYAGQFSYVDYDDLTDANIPHQFPVPNERLKRASAADFAAIPGSPIAYWVSEKFRNTFATGTPLVDHFRTAQGMATGENARFVRLWHEVSIFHTGLAMPDRATAQRSGKKWFPYNKGGDFRRWYGNQEFLVNWLNDGVAIRTFTDDAGKLRSVIRNPDAYFQQSVSWSKISSGMPAFRLFPQGFIFDVAGTSIFTNDDQQRLYILGLMNSQVTLAILRAISPTLNFEVGHISSIPLFIDIIPATNTNPITTLIALARADWDAYETSWDFSTLPLLRADVAAPTLAERYQRLQAHWQAQVAQMHALEVENNRIFIDAYGLADELSPDVPLREITLTCNPVYRYGDKPADELATLQRADTVRELLSYAIGCMFGRYSLDKPGLILANAGDGLAEYVAAVGMPLDQVRFAPDDDGVIPIVADDWFADDIVVRTRAFVRAAVDQTYLEQNMTFIEQSLGRSVRDYFAKDFYKDHLQTYKKRPIYWMISSPKGTFKALIYLHRYRTDTMSVVLKYLRQYTSGVQQAIEAGDERLRSASIDTRERNALTKQLDARRTQLVELREFESKVYDLASQQIAIDLDDGVKVNYLKFRDVLVKIPGLDKDDDN